MSAARAGMSHPRGMLSHMDFAQLLVPMLVSLLIGVVLGALAASWLATRRGAVVQAQLAAATSREAELTRRGERAEADLAIEREARQRDVQQAAERERGGAGVLAALAPVRQQLEHMQRAVSAIEQDRQRQFGQLSEQLRARSEHDERLRSATEALGSALRSGSSRGTWGEAQLRNVVSAAGLLDRVDFVEQRTVRGEERSGRPDMLVTLPGGGTLVLDAKAPLDKYLAAQALSAAAGGEEAERRAKLLSEHAKAVRGHVDALAKRDYPALVDGSPDLVIAYLPLESALSAAIEADPALLDHAFSRGIALTSPVSLWSVMRAVAHAWRGEQLSEQAKQLTRESRTLYARLATAAGHIERLGRSLNSSISHYNAFVGSLENRVLPTARRIAELDASDPIDTPPTIEQHARSLSAPELTGSTPLTEHDENSAPEHRE